MHDPFFSSDMPREGLNQISTRWPLIQDPVKFVMRYAPAIQGYLGVFLKNPHDVEDVCQVFLLRVVERGLVEKTAIHGRFRDYLIASVRNAALAHLRRKATTTLEIERLAQVPAEAGPEFPADEEWIAGWRKVVLTSVWEALENHQNDNPGSLNYSTLRTLVDHPQETSTQLAERVSRLCGRIVQPAAFRKQVSRGRRLFAELLVAEIARTLENATPLRIEEELIDIGVMKYVQPFLPPDWRTSGELRDAD
ncbi:MAG: sigma-70 family RNA polymerase sigma factor [Planctomycetota bacterium]